jgi:transcriptional regulator with XRE-family HTH domain
MMSLGPRIKELRIEASLNKAALARRVGVSDVTISYWESGAIKQIGHERLVSLAQALGCPLSRLIQGETTARAAPLYLRSAPPVPWQDPSARTIEIPAEMLPSQRWEGDCYLLTPAPGATFDYIDQGDLIAIAATEHFQQSGLYLVETQGINAIRKVDQNANGELQLTSEAKDESVAHYPQCRLLGKLVAHWQPSRL